MLFFKIKYDQLVRDVIFVLCTKLGPVWAKGEMRGLLGGGRLA